MSSFLLASFCSSPPVERELRGRVMRSPKQFFLFLLCFLLAAKEKAVRENSKGAFFFFFSFCSLAPSRTPATKLEPFLIFSVALIKRSGLWWHHDDQGHHDVSTFIPLTVFISLGLGYIPPTSAGLSYIPLTVLFYWTRVLSYQSVISDNQI